ncbi:MAG TPA: fructosamine kinase family protein [Casimicrobiaceae bacterium]|nr:fructosamine kinase family protein [Casimicrobiaceae bacterium]
MHEWQHAILGTLETLGLAIRDGQESVWSRIGGNATTSVWSLRVASRRYFIKVAASQHADMLAAEVEALRAIAATGAIRVPAVYANGEARSASYLALEWLDIVEGGRSAALGEALAKLHETTAPAFGWHRDNAIGATPQPNAWGDDWPTFFRDRRIAPQLALARTHGFDGPLQASGAKLLDRVDRLLEGHRPGASLLHGDLWAGNAGRIDEATPVVFDPASYYGDREADLAMTELFGGFEPAFYAAYCEASPLPPGYPRRRTLYNLYHVLNHLNLFGASYLAQAEQMLEELVKSR